MSAARPILCVVGDLVEDLVVWPEQAVINGTDNPCVMHRTRGGSAANVAALAAEHIDTRFIGCVGDDLIGESLERALASTGVDVRLERRDRTGSVVVVVDPTGERTIFADRAAAAQLSTESAEWVDDVDVLHIPAYGFSGGPTADAVRAMAGVVRARGGAVTVDASASSLVFELGAATFMRLIQEVGATLLFANRDEARALGIDSDSDGTAALPPALTVIVKDGARPVRILSAGAMPIEVPAEPVAEVRDTTGAGDAFAAGALAAWMRGSDLATACLAGHRVAAQVLATPGAGGQPTAHSQGACL